MSTIIEIGTQVSAGSAKPGWLGAVVAYEPAWLGWPARYEILFDDGERLLVDVEQVERVR